MAPNAAYVQRGEALDYKNETEELIPCGTVVVIGAHAGVTGCDIPPGQLGTLHMTGVFRMAKSGGAAMEMGQSAYFDGAGVTGTASGDAVEIGYAAAPAGETDETVLVRLHG